MVADTLDALPADALRAGEAASTSRVLVFDSGLGGLTVLQSIVEAMPSAALTFVADDAVFPYGALDDDTLIARVMTLMEELEPRHQPAVIVIACHTASTLVLPPLRARWPSIDIVGTVPAIKPAVALSRSRMVSVLATPGTVARQYTRDLVQQFAEDCTVTLVGSSTLAAMAEAAMRGEGLEDARVADAIAPAFVEADERRTDAVVLACTHYPLLLETLQRVAPWPVTWIDPAPAIARRVAQVARDRGFRADGGADVSHPIPAIFTSGRVPGPVLAGFLRRRGLASEAMRLAPQRQAANLP